MYSFLIMLTAIVFSLMLITFVIGAGLDTISGYVVEVETRERLDVWGTRMRTVTNITGMALLLLIALWTVIGAGWVIYLAVIL